jgi:elongation factor G
MRRAHSVCFVGHSGSGKTALAEAMLRAAGTTGDTALDRTPEEKHRKQSIELAVGSCTWKGQKVDLIVTPGLGEFVEEIHKGVAAADLVVLVVNAEKPVEVVTEQAWDIRRAAGRPAIVFVNMLDKPLADPDAALAAVRQALDGKFVPLQLPLRDGSKFLGLVDVFTGAPTSGKLAVSEEAKVHAEELRAELVEEAATADDALLEKVLADEKPSRDEVLAALRAGMNGARLVPVLWGSVQGNHGVQELLDALLVLSPGGVEEPGTKLRVFSLALDPYLGKLAYAKVLAGEVRDGDTLFNLGTKDKLQVRDVYGYVGAKLEKTGRAAAGSVAALGKLEGLALGTTIASDVGAPPEPPIVFPKPVFIRAMAAKSQADEEKVSTALRDLVATRATLTFHRDPVTKEGLVAGMGDVHLDVLAERLRNKYGVEVHYKVPKVPYRETVRKSASAMYRHKKQTGGHGQFGEVHLRVDPLPRGSGFEFADEIKGGVIPQQFIPGVEKGVREALDEGVLAGFPVVDVKAAVYYGTYHEVDSSELSFKIAARTAFKMATENAEPTLLEPIMSLAVTAPDGFTGDIISDVTSRRGRILGMEAEGGRTTIRVEVPMAETLSYALDLKALTQGRATFQVAPARYDFVPAQLQERLLAQLRAAADEG